MTLSGELDTMLEQNGVTFDKGAADKNPRTERLSSGPAATFRESPPISASSAAVSDRSQKSVQIRSSRSGWCCRALDGSRNGPREAS